MPLQEFKQGSVICNAGEPLRHLFFITKGTAECTFNGHNFKFDQGDTIGLYALSTGSHTHTYKVTTDITAFSYQYDDFSSLETLMRDNADVANLFVVSMCRQVSKFLQYKQRLKQESERAYKYVKDVYPIYERLCERFAFTSKKLAESTNLSHPSTVDQIDDWLNEYYLEIKSVESATLKGFFRKPGISVGFLRRSIADIDDVMHTCKKYQDYLRNISWLFLSNGGSDLFTLISELHLNAINIKGADAAVETLMTPLNALLSNMSYIDRALYETRQASYKSDLAEKREHQVITTVSAGSGGAKTNLADSLEEILKYSECAPELSNKFTKYVRDYTALTDRASSDDTAHHIRRELTTMFNEIYTKVLIKSVTTAIVPSTIIKMFLNFGYVDSALAGHENADYLYSIADTVKGDPISGVYTVSEWMAKIYAGEREPCRNEFDMDYAGYVQELKSNYKIDEAEAAALLQNTGEKLKFEMENIFPIVNKLTFGRITTFCPLFSDNNIQRGLETSLVTPALLKSNFDEIRNIDYSAFYRETVYSNPEIGVPKETVHVEVMPEVILMPNLGIRGIMWQEIEGRKRTTPARMFMPLFMLTDLRTLVITLTGEFRWEMCKRIQGIRWNDVTDPSLTSEYCDYLQFYRTNRELSTDVKAGVKAELSRARNNWKNVFVLNYIDWIMYESNSSQRLNKFARKIMTMYCPFSAAIRDSLGQNPQYAELIKRFTFKQQQREQLLSRSLHKLSQTVKELPQELLNELEYMKK
ncbi:MAG: cyclic nucleotide-binding domain-containing protein [Defluviitaleaceae bacterium]|nr:cyclic nucleotide-binding domain-containing protein [Defluviitaleaceae bacterium]